MDLESVCRLFQNSCNMDQNVRRAAEDELTRSRTRSGFAAAVLNLVANPQVPEESRLGGAVYLKNCAKNNWAAQADEQLSAQDKQAIKQNIVGVVLDCPPSSRRSLADCVTHIAECDFPHQWPDLTDELVKRAEFAIKDRKALVGIFTLMHSIFVRYRSMGELTQELVEEIQPIAHKSGPCLNAVMGMLCQDLAQPSHPLEHVVETIKLLKLCTQIYHDLTCIDLPEYFDVGDDVNRVSEFMTYYLQIMRYENPALEKNASYEERPLEELKAAVTDVLTLFLTKYDDDFQPYLSAFAEIIWGSSTKVTDDTRYDERCIAGMDFLAATARSIHHVVFKEDRTLSTVCEQIVIPNIRIRDVDVQMFDEEGEEFIRTDIEGSDAHTRRRSACELTHALCKNYQARVSEIFQTHAINLLKQYEATKDWKAKDCAIYLITALSTKQSVSAIASSGLRDVEGVNVYDFFATYILPELNPNGNPTNPEFPVLKADAIKFVSTFRNQIPAKDYPACIGVLTEWLKCSSEVVVTYAASTIERLLSTKDPATKQEHVQKCHMDALIGPCFQNLFTAIHTSLRENHYLMQCVMRVIMTAQDLCGPFIAPILQPLTEILAQVTKNPSNPAYNHYLFESISALVKYSTAQVPAIEEAIFGPFAIILDADVVEFMPYVFQIFAQLLEARPDVPPCYAQLLPLLVKPDLYKNKGNVPAVVRLLTVFVEKVPMVFVNDGHLNPVLGIFAQLAKSKTLDHEAFVLVNALVMSVPYDHLQQYMPKIMVVMCQRLSTSKTVKFCKMLILFCSLFIYKRGPDDLISMVEKIQAGLWKMMFMNVWVQNVGKVDGAISKKACQIALTKISCESQLMPTQFPQEWVRGVRATVALLAGETVEDKEGDMYSQLTYSAASLGSKYDEGYTNAYCPLQCASKPEVDFCADIPNATEYFQKSWSMVQANPQFSSMAPPLRQSGMPPDHLKFLSLG